MRCSTLAIGLTITVALVAPAPATAQQSLGDVAGSIKLKRPEGEAVVIDGDAITQSRRGPTGGTDSRLLSDIVGDCLTETTALRDLAEETRDGTSFYRDPWRGRVEAVGFRLDGALEEFRMVAVDGRYQEAYGLAGRGADLAGDALVILRNAIADDRPVFSESKTFRTKRCVFSKRRNRQSGRRCGRMLPGRGAVYQPDRGESGHVRPLRRTVRSRIERVRQLCRWAARSCRRDGRAVPPGRRARCSIFQRHPPRLPFRVV